jgi:putative ABC transport system permease protein
MSVTVEGRAPTTPAADAEAHVRAVTPDFFGTMRVPLMRGRPFANADRADAVPVAIVNQAMVAKYWPGQDPIGKRVRIGASDDPSPSAWYTVVGVVGNVKHWNLVTASEPELYRPMAQSPAARFSFVVRARTDASRLTAPVRDALLEVDGEQPATIQPMEQLVSASFAQTRFRSLLLASFAVLALALALVGLYGVISYAVTRRTREIGVRLALGAQRGDIVGLVLGEGMMLCVAGLAIGLVSSVWVNRLLAGMLFQVEPTDAATFATVSLLLSVTAAVANYLPARRAAGVDPLLAIKVEG